MELRNDFIEAGGEEFTLIPCLNDNDDWVSVLKHYSEEQFR